MIAAINATQSLPPYSSPKIWNPPASSSGKFANINRSIAGSTREKVLPVSKPSSAVYQRWHYAVLSYRNGEPPAHGAIWLTRYPSVMVEWFLHVLTVSTLYPRGPQKTLNLVEFFYPEENASFEPYFIEAQQAAYMETCKTTKSPAYGCWPQNSSCTQRQ